ncbi:unnamed protein product, partial [Allacma fusca]
GVKIKLNLKCLNKEQADKWRFVRKL